VLTACSRLHGSEKDDLRFIDYQRGARCRAGETMLSWQRNMNFLGPWKSMLDLGLTTWAEKPEPTRSDSHAWSAHPTVNLLTLVAGVEPATPGFATVRIRPHLGSLSTLSATVPTPRGDVVVAYRTDGAGLTADVTLPPGVTGTIELLGQQSSLSAGKNSVQR